MTKPPFALLTCAASLPLVLLACSSESPPTPEEVRSAISSDLGNVLQQSSDALAGAPDALPGGAALAMVQHLLGDPALLPVQMMSARLLADDAAPAIDPGAETAYLNDNVFSNANHVSDGIYQIPPSLLCTRTTSDGNGGSHDTTDAACVQQVTQIDLRIRVARQGDGLVFALQVDAAHDEPLRLELSHTSIALTVNLDDAQHAFVALAAVVGKDLPNVSLAGEVTAKLEALGPAKAKISFSIDRAIAIRAAGAGVDLASSDAFSFTSAAADGVAFTLDAAQQAGALDLDGGRTELNVPATDGTPRLGLTIAGVTASAAFGANLPLTLSKLGLGGSPLLVTVDGARAVSLDASFGDQLALTLSHDDAAGTSTLAASSSLELQIAVDHAALGNTAPVYDVSKLHLEGSLRGHDADDQLEVVTGGLAITTNPASYGFSASAGQCVTSSDATDPTTGAPFTQWTVAACQ